MTGELSKRGAELAKREERIETLMSDFEVYRANKVVQVGKELEAIRSSKLYEETHDTFEGYIKDRWGKSRSWGYKVIEHTGVLKNLGFDGEQQSDNVERIPQTPSFGQTAILSQLPPEEQGEAYQEAQQEAAAEGKEAPSTKQVKASVQKRKSAAGTPLQAPKTSMKAPDGSQFGKFLGQAVRFLDTYCEHHNVQNGERHKRILKRLNGADEAFAELRGIVER